MNKTDREYEVISHNNAGFNVFLVNMLYRTVHIHKDFEICIVLSGNVDVNFSDHSFSAGENDIIIINPYQRHSFRAESPALMLSLQISPQLLSAYYPKISYTEFQENLVEFDKNGKSCDKARSCIFETAKNHFSGEPLSVIECVAMLNMLFYILLSELPVKEIAEEERRKSSAKGNRMRNIMRYLDEHYTEKVLLSDIAEEENLDLFYLSHFFKDCFGMPFQSYVSQKRCEKARQMLLLSDLNLFDVCISCGFSDPKYFNRDFKSMYGCSPGEYRKRFNEQELPQQQASLLSTQEFLSTESSRLILSKYT